MSKKLKRNNPKKQIKQQKQGVPPNTQNFQSFALSLKDFGMGLWLIGGFALFVSLLFVDLPLTILAMSLMTPIILTIIKKS